MPAPGLHQGAHLGSGGPGGAATPRRRLQARLWSSWCILLRLAEIRTETATGCQGTGRRFYQNWFGSIRTSGSRNGPCKTAFRPIPINGGLFK